MTTELVVGALPDPVADDLATVTVPMPVYGEVPLPAGYDGRAVVAAAAAEEEAGLTPPALTAGGAAAAADAGAVGTTDE